MARKRMISPEIWESQNFSQLSDVAKIVFISLFSHADDEGRGRADPTFIKSSTFPYDEGRRVADIKNALSEIARSMSVQFYSVNGIEYYFMTSWGRWQKIDKPSKSKFPPPPIVGEGGDIHSTENFPEDSPNIPRIFPEDSPTNIIEDNIKEYPPISPQEGEVRTKAKERFLSTYPKLKAYKKYDDSRVDYKVLYKCFAKSAFLRNSYSMKWVCENYDRIVSGAFEDGKGRSTLYQSEATVAADKRTDREHHYAVLRQKALSKVEEALRLAEQDSDFKQADSAMKKCEIELAKAEVFSPQSVDDIKKRIALYQKSRADALLKLNLSDGDFIPNYACKKCSDTGFLPDGRACDCYKQ